VLIGENATGKTNFLDCFAFISEAMLGNLPEAIRGRNGMRSLLWAGGSQAVSFVVEIMRSLRYEAEIASLGRTHQVAYEKLSLTPAGKPEKVLLEVKAGQGEACWGDWRAVLRPRVAKPDLSWLLRSRAPQPTLPGVTPERQLQVDDTNLSLAQVGGFPDQSPYWLAIMLLSLSRLYRPIDATAGGPIRQPQLITNAVYPGVSADDLPSVLFNLDAKEEHTPKFAGLKAALEAGCRDFDSVRVEVVEPGKISLRWKEKHFAREFVPEELSDGTLRFLFLATALLTAEPAHPALICVDTPELDMHPKMLDVVAELLKAASQRTQVIASTHSPLLVGHFEPEDVLIVEKQDGATRLRRASDRADLRGWLEKFTLGELMASGELERPE
jgi:predicted ATPase